MTGGLRLQAGLVGTGLKLESGLRLEWHRFAWM